MLMKQALFTPTPLPVDIPRLSSQYTLCDNLIYQHDVRDVVPLPFDFVIASQTDLFYPRTMSPQPPPKNDLSPGIAGLLEIMAMLRDPEDGCPWDVEQDFTSIAPHTIEEAYEVAEAIEQQDMDGLRDELGDLLLQVVFHAQMAQEDGLFDFGDVVIAISDKLVRRHPHVFADATIDDAEHQTRAWETQKARERADKARAAGQNRVSALDGVSTALPAITRSYKLQARAARVGFDWPTPDAVIAKLEEELEEVREEITDTPDKARLTDELGDLLMATINLARKLKIEPETALRHGNAKFVRRFKYIEAALAEDGRTPEEASLDEMERLWGLAKLEKSE